MAGLPGKKRVFGARRKVRRAEGGNWVAPQRARRESRFWKERILLEKILPFSY